MKYPQIRIKNAWLLHQNASEHLHTLWAKEGDNLIDHKGVDENVANKLGLDWSSAVFGDVMAAYRAQYSHLSLTNTVGTISVVKFNDPLPALFKPTRIDKDLQT